MPLFGFRSKAAAEQANATARSAEFRRPAGEVGRNAAELQNIHTHLAGDWDVIEDPAVEAEAKRLAAETVRRAEVEAARQDAERQRLVLEMKLEADKIARQERIQRLVVTAATTLRARALAAPGRWDGFTRQFEQAHRAIDETIQNTCCWRCGQRGRLPVEDAGLLGSQSLPMRPGGARDEEVIRGARELQDARRAAVEAWRSYNNRRLVTERLRIAAYYHPILADRFGLVRDCEVCGSRGVFHAEHVAGTRHTIQLSDTHFVTRGEESLDSRWELAIMDGFARVPGRIYGTNWVPITQLTRAQAKEWLMAPRREVTSREVLEYQAAKAHWDEGIANGSIRPFTRGNSIAWAGRVVGSHVEVGIKSFSDRTFEEKFVNEPRRPLRALQEDWPDMQYWMPGGPHPDRWKGGPHHKLFIKPGVEYAPAAQDPLSKEPRITPPPPPNDTPTVARLHGRRSYWSAAQ
jgi:hypothetical protein